MLIDCVMKACLEVEIHILNLWLCSWSFLLFDVLNCFFICKQHFSKLLSLFVGTLAKYTGGQVYYYPSFQSAHHGEKLRHELARDLTRETAWEAVMRIRCGKGLSIYIYVPEHYFEQMHIHVKASLL